jgi:hypothetical protein
MNPATNFDRVEKIAEAVLYEGYMLYPYRASAIKNQQRWNFGVLCPQSYSEQQNGSDAWMMQTQCLIEAGPLTRLNVKVRCLQVVNRTIGKLSNLLHELPADREPAFEVVDHLETGGQTFMPWQEAVEREVMLPSLRPDGLSSNAPALLQFHSGKEFEPLRNENDLIAGVIIRERKNLSGFVEVDAEPSKNGVAKITVSIKNSTPVEPSQTRADALLYSFISTHTMLNVEGGQFVSLIDPPENLKCLTAECRNVGTWPVLVGEEGERETMLSSPIILYDYPQIAPESPGSLFDGTEIDEILSLRILTMTDEEKREMRQSDARAREILERTESMPPEQFMKLHGVLRGLHPVTGETR